MPLLRLDNTATATAANARTVTAQSTIFVVQRLLLGCGKWHAFIGARGGQKISEIPFATLNMQRRVDDMSSASIVIDDTALSTSRHSPASPFGAIPDCCEILGSLNPWQHELQLWRDDNTGATAPVWVGPVVTPAWTRSEQGDQTLTISARDLFQWFERRLQIVDRQFVQVDLSTIFKRYVDDAIFLDPSINLTTLVLPTGILGDRASVSVALRRASDDLRELARSGVDFTVIGRTMIIGGTEIPTADLGTLITEHFRSLTLTVDGLQTETESWVTGGNQGTTNTPVLAFAGGIDPTLGLLMSVIQEPTITDYNSALAEATSRLALLSQTPMLITGVLAPEAPVSFDLLIPGAKVQLRLQLLCRQIVGTFRLSDVQVQVGPDGSEAVQVTFSTLGTTGGG